MATPGYGVTDILFLGANDKMVRTNALWVIARVANNQVSAFLAQTSGGVELTNPTNGSDGDAIDLELPVPEPAIIGTFPGPAPVKVARIDIFPETVLVSVALCDAHPTNIRLRLGDVKENVHRVATCERGNRGGRCRDGRLRDQENLGPAADGHRDSDVLDAARGCNLQDDRGDALVVDNDDVGRIGVKIELACVKGRSGRAGDVQHGRGRAEQVESVNQDDRSLLSVLGQVQLGGCRRKG